MGEMADDERLTNESQNYKQKKPSTNEEIRNNNKMSNDRMEFALILISIAFGVIR